MVPITISPNATFTEEQRDEYRRRLVGKLVRTQMASGVEYVGIVFDIDFYKNIYPIYTGSSDDYRLVATLSRLDGGKRNVWFDTHTWEVHGE